MKTTPALRALRAAGVRFDQHSYRYEDHGGTRVSARNWASNEHIVIETLVLATDRGSSCWC